MALPRAVPNGTGIVEAALRTGCRSDALGVRAAVPPGNAACTQQSAVQYRSK